MWTVLDVDTEMIGLCPVFGGLKYRVAAFDLDHGEFSHVLTSSHLDGTRCLVVCRRQHETSIVVNMFAQLFGSAKFVAHTNSPFASLGNSEH